MLYDVSQLKVVLELVKGQTVARNQYSNIGLNSINILYIRFMKDEFSNTEREPSLKILKQLMKEVAEEAKQKAVISNQKLMNAVNEEVKRLNLKYKF